MSAQPDVKETEALPEWRLSDLYPSHKAPEFAAAMIISAAMKARAMLVAYWVEVIGLAPVEDFATVSNSLMLPQALLLS